MKYMVLCFGVSLMLSACGGYEREQETLLDENSSVSGAGSSYSLRAPLVEGGPISGGTTYATASANCLNGTTVSCSGSLCVSTDAVKNDDGTYSDGYCDCRSPGQGNDDVKSCTNAAGPKVK